MHAGKGSQRWCALWEEVPEQSNHASIVSSPAYRPTKRARDDDRFFLARVRGLTDKREVQVRGCNHELAEA